jgi:hypothetical protein
MLVRVHPVLQKNQAIQIRDVCVFNAQGVKAILFRLLILYVTQLGLGGRVILVMKRKAYVMNQGID